MVFEPHEASPPHAAPLHIGHVLVMDIVGYSRMKNDEQRQCLVRLQQIVRATPEFQRAQEGSQLICVPCGDGIALVFFVEPVAPLSCALGISHALHGDPMIKLRMGLHSGGVHHVPDINTNPNVAGEGINIAHRIMDCGDAGHILLSQRVVEDLSHSGNWTQYMHDLGEVEVKHGVNVHIFNFYTDEVGNPQRPTKIRPKFRVGEITICQFHRTVNYLPLYVAQQRKYFQQEGLLVNIIDGHGDDRAWSKVKQGEAQFGVADPVMMLEEDQIQGKVVSSIVNRAALWGMTKKPLAPIRDFKELQGKIIAVYSAPSTSYMIICRILADHQLQDSVVIQQMAPGSEYNILDAPEVDIVLVPEPMVTVMEQNGAHKIFSASQYFRDFLFTGLFTTVDYINQNPGVVQSVVNAIERSLCFIRTNSTNALQVAAKEFTDLPEFAIELATLKLLSERVIPKHTTVPMNGWSRCVQVRRPKDSSSFLFDTYVDNSFAHRAVAELGGLRRR
jgi:NitT/TauT family transport system substrate-binding protein